MTLTEWCERADILPITTNSGAVTLTASDDVTNFTDLWRLSDFKVSTRSGPVIWLVPIKPTNTETTR